MNRISDQKPPKKRSANLTIREDIIYSAKELDINMSREAEKGIAAAIKKKREEQWLAENKDAIAAHNERVRKHGLSIPPIWEQRESE